METDRQIKWIKNSIPKTPDGSAMELMSIDAIRSVRKFHCTFPQYSPTPLASLDNLAQKCGVAGIYVKDESKRYELNSFKVLGASYAMAGYIAQKLGRDIEELSHSVLLSEEVRSALGDFTFYTATDGNHGRAVAWSAAQMGQKSVVFMPKGSSLARSENIQKLGAEVTVTQLNYDDAVRLALTESQKNQNSVVIQDTAWEGYTDIPSWIMQGYGTVALEAMQQLNSYGVSRPSHIIVQAGVGAFAGSFAGFFAGYYAKELPTIIVVEPHVADCHYQSALKADGSTVAVGGELNSIMAGLACGEVNDVSWEILKNKAAFFTSVPDCTAAKGMRVLGCPIGGDAQVVSGESGAAPMGLLAEILTNPSCEALRNAACLDETSNVLMVSTEGDTDPESYRRIVWDGEHPSV